MNLKEYQEKYGIKRINFDSIKVDKDLDEERGIDNLVCPYCGKEFEYESEDIDDILHGATYQCPNCEKWFYAKGEIIIDTTCTPIEQAVLDNRSYIEANYKLIDECEKKGMDFPDYRYGFVEWETYRDWERPLFENMEEGAE